MESGIYFHMIEQSRREYLISRIMENSIMRPNGCLEWTATKNKAGYGLIHFAARKGDGWKSSVPAHRAHYMAHHNIILERNQFVCHRCDNPSCVNIEHLFVGSPKDNMQDMLAKDRHSKSRQLHTRHRVYDNETIRAIKLAKGTLKAVASAFGVSEGYVSKLRAGKAKTLIS